VEAVTTVVVILGVMEAVAEVLVIMERQQEQG
jgi:hypothetical protein